MKKALIIIATSVLSCVSCDKEYPFNTHKGEEASTTEIIFDLTANHPDGNATKTVKTGWENGDVIFIFFNNISAPKYLKMRYDGSVWSYIQMNGSLEASLNLAENASGSMRAVYLPFGCDASISKSGSSFVFSNTTFSYYLTATLDYTVTNGRVSGNFDMQIPEGYIQFFLDDTSASSSHEIELREPHLTPQGISSISADGTISHTNVAQGAPLPGYLYDKEFKETGESKGYLFSGILSPEARNTPLTYSFTLVSGGYEGAYYSKSFVNKSWYRGETEGRALKMPTLSEWAIISSYQPIDLCCDNDGKRIYWASHNMGASAPNEFGDYYAWGETAPYYNELDPLSWKAGMSDGYEWDSYRWSIDSRYSLTKYNNKSTYGTVDNKTTLEPEDDVARVMLGGKWRMPTMPEWLSLKNCCNWTWTTQNGVNGRLVTSKTNGNSIFLPAAGYWDGTTFDRANSTGFYWSSSLNTNAAPEAYNTFFDSGTACNAANSYYRYTGTSVRAVSE